MTPVKTNNLNECNSGSTVRGVTSLCLNLRYTLQEGMHAKYCKSGWDVELRGHRVAPTTIIFIYYCYFSKRTQHQTSL